MKGGAGERWDVEYKDVVEPGFAFQYTCSRNGNSITRDVTGSSVTNYPFFFHLRLASIFCRLLHENVGDVYGCGTEVA